MSRVGCSWHSPRRSPPALGLVSEAAAAHKPKTLTVAPAKHDASCPDARFDSIREAIEAAGTGDTVFVCAGTYVEGSGDVRHERARDPPRPEPRRRRRRSGVRAAQARGRGQIAAEKPSLRHGNGYLLAVIGHRDKPIDVDVSGITFDANGVYATAGIVFRRRCGIARTLARHGPRRRRERRRLDGARRFPEQRLRHRHRDGHARRRRRRSSRRRR